MVAHHPLAPPLEGREGASYIEGVYSFLGQDLDRYLGSCVLAHVFSVVKERQGRLFAGRVDEDFVGKSQCRFTQQGPSF